MLRDREFLDEILEAIDAIQEVESLTDIDRLMRTRFFRSAILHELTIIGEASGKLPDELMRRYPEIPWPDIIGQRHVIVHSYYSLDWQRLWLTITQDVPVLRQQIAAIIAAEYPPETRYPDYAVVIFYSAEDECYVADIPDLRFCSAFGDSPEAALREIQIARDLWLESARDHGNPIPERTFGPPFDKPTADS